MSKPLVSIISQHIHVQIVTLGEKQIPFYLVLMTGEIKVKTGQTWVFMST